jgi:predicted alpha/beta hydrolase family esterase
MKARDFPVALASENSDSRFSEGRHVGHLESRSSHAHWPDCRMIMSSRSPNRCTKE